MLLLVLLLLRFLLLLLLLSLPMVPTGLDRCPLQGLLLSSFFRAFHIPKICNIGLPGVVKWICLVFILSVKKLPRLLGSKNGRGTPR